MTGFKQFLIVLLGALTAAAAHGQAARNGDSFAITHVTVVDTEGTQDRREVTVVVRDSRIQSIEPAANVLPVGVREVDGRGKFLLPGLWDMHVHLSWVTDSALPVLVANGVTGVRDLGSDLDEIDEWRAKIDAGIVVGPRIVRVGPILNGQSFNKYQIATGGPDQARGIVRALTQVGVDYIKVHRRVPRDDYFAIVDEAKKQGLRVVGHIPITVTPEEASDAGQLIEHTETLFEGTFFAALSSMNEMPGAIARFRGNTATELFARFVRNKTPVTPTLGAWRYLLDYPGTSFLADPRMRYVARSQRDAAAAATQFSAEQLATLRLTYAEWQKTVDQMARSGVVLLAGTDVAAARIPGFMLHEELVALVAAGLTQREALRTATSNPAKILNRDADLGTVAPGKLADLLLLDADPLQDIHNTQRIAAVVVNGRLFDRAALDSLLRLGEEAASHN